LRTTSPALITNCGGWWNCPNVLVFDTVLEA
jgi:hypothetical protein